MTEMVLEVRNWEIASGCMFAYTAVLGAVLGGLTPTDRARALVGSLVAFAILGASALASPNPILHGWLLPPLLLLLSYWITGRLFTVPMPRTECALRQVDRALAIRTVAALVPRWLAEVLEFAYAAVYAAIPAALILQTTLGGPGGYDRFWTVILVTDYVCFGMLPWVRTRPPRALEEGAPWHSALRRLNLRVLGAVSIRVNTFPSGHAAEALAAALLTIHAPPAVVALMMVNALAVSAGAVLGRYHYALDAATGWLVAIVVWWTLG
jgi:membrane-associated phospholipid phosphatase